MIWKVNALTLPKGEERDLSQDVSYFSRLSIRSGEVTVKACIKNKPFDLPLFKFSNVIGSQRSIIDSMT